jgi:RNA polymerase sigma-70 factor (ECF subfamily)
MDDRLGLVSFEELYRRDRRSVVALAYGLSGSRSGAEELAQEAFLAAFKAWDRIGRYDDPGAWVRRVVVNRSVSGVRRRVAEARALARLAGRAVPPAELAPQDDEFWRAVRALSRRQAQVVALRYVDVRWLADIALILECAEGPVKALLFKARHALAATLGLAADDEEAP